MKSMEAMLLVMKLVILITMVTTSVKQIMRGYSIVKTDYLTHQYLK